MHRAHGQATRNTAEMLVARSHGAHTENPHFRYILKNKTVIRKDNFHLFYISDEQVGNISYCGFVYIVVMRTMVLKHFKNKQGL